MRKLTYWYHLGYRGWWGQVERGKKGKEVKGLEAQQKREEETQGFGPLPTSVRFLHE